jgi:hypothetical protein
MSTDLCASFSAEQLLALKSALGIDLIPGFSFGVWGSFKEEFLK